MKFKIKIILIIIILLFLSGCNQQINKTKIKINTTFHNNFSFKYNQDLKSNLNITNQTKIIIKVKDNLTQEPIKDAFVFINKDSCYSNEKGICIINFKNNFGDYAVSGYKKGYDYNLIRVKLKRNKINRFNLTLNPIKIKNITTQGKIIKIIELKGTRSESIYFYLHTKNKDYFIFNKYYKNKGFDKYINKSVIIKGYFIKGFAGWMNRKENGILIEDITEVKLQK